MLHVRGDGVQGGRRNIDAALGIPVRHRVAMYTTYGGLEGFAATGFIWSAMSFPHAVMVRSRNGGVPTVDIK